MKTMWKVIAFTALALVALGGILIGTSILTGADYVRIQDLFNTAYNVGSLNEYFINVIQNILGVQPL